MEIFLFTYFFLIGILEFSLQENSGYKEIQNSVAPNGATVFVLAKKIDVFVNRDSLCFRPILYNMNTIHWQIIIAAFFILLLLISLRKRRRHPMRTGDLVFYVHPNPEPGIINNVITEVLDADLSPTVCILRWAHTTTTALKAHCTILPVDLRSDVFVPEKPCARTYNIDTPDTLVELGSEVSPESVRRLSPYNDANFRAIPLDHFGYTLGIRDGILTAVD